LGVAQAPEDTLILADGYSCREQITQGMDRRTLHLAEAIALAQSAPVLAEGLGRNSEAYCAA
jgi:hypothetical protein